MNSRERVLRTFRYEPTDRVACDFMEGAIWPHMMEHFRTAHQLADIPAVLEHFDVDFRWYSPTYSGPKVGKDPGEMTWDDYLMLCTYSDHVTKRELADARTVADLEKHAWPNPDWWDASSINQVRVDNPDRAIVIHCGWMPLFCTAADLFGIEEALVKMALEPVLFEAYVRRQHEFYLALLERCLTAAEGIADVCWLGDDVATQRSMMMSPEMWARYFKEPLRQQVEVAHRHGMFTLFHSCGSVRAILPDLIDIGMDGLLTFQTTADGMDAASIARDFGGKMVFYGGMDVQHLLSRASEAEVRAEVRRNVNLFADCGGYVVANAHGNFDLKPASLAAMLQEAHAYRPAACSRKIGAIREAPGSPVGNKPAENKV
jgi:uroporphyrinogen decarboxylase